MSAEQRMRGDIYFNFNMFTDISGPQMSGGRVHSEQVREI